MEIGTKSITADQRAAWVGSQGHAASDQVRAKQVQESDFDPASKGTGRHGVHRTGTEIQGGRG
jgi:hypothetical protein